jgi:hypothetical protein
VYLLSHPLEEPHPVVADCQLQAAPAAPGAPAGPSLGDAPGDAGAGAGGRPGSSFGDAEGVAYSGWTNESVVWSSGQLPFVATYNDVSGGPGGGGGRRG